MLHQEPSISIMDVKVFHITAPPLSQEIIIGMELSFLLSHPGMIEFMFAIMGHEEHIQMSAHPACSPRSLLRERATRTWRVKPGDLYTTVVASIGGQHKDTFLKLVRVGMRDEKERNFA